MTGENHKFGALDTLRTIMALSVATGHYFYWNGTATKFPWSFFLAVDFFFVLSGFVLTRSIMSDRSASMEPFLQGFVVRRVFRLFPLYWLLFVPAVALLVYKHRAAVDPAFFFGTSALLLQAMGFDTGAKFIFADTMIGIAWSISVEFWVGLLWFPLVYCLRDAPKKLALLSVGLAIVALLFIVNFSPNTLNVNLQRFAGVVTFGALRGLLGFALGTVALLVYRAAADSASGGRFVPAVELAVVLILGMLYLDNGYTRQNEFLAPPLFFVLITCIALGGGIVARALSWQFWAPVRPLSYAIYLVHPFFVFAWREIGLPFSHRLLPVYLLLICVSAFACYRLVEAPWILRGRMRASSTN